MLFSVVKCAKHICCDVFFPAQKGLVSINFVFGNPALSFCVCNLANLASLGPGFGDTQTINVIWGSQYFGTFLSTVFFLVAQQTA